MPASLIFLWILLQGPIFLGFSWRPPNEAEEFHKKTEIFWAFQEDSGFWVQIKLPYDLISCSASSCRQVATIRGAEEREEEDEGTGDRELPVRKGVSITRMSETSIWATGQSGRIYERFWNGIKWVAAPHDLPMGAGNAIETFTFYQSIFALSEDGKLYKLQLGEDNQPDWAEILPVLEGNEGSTSAGRLRFRAASHNRDIAKERFRGRIHYYRDIAEKGGKYFKGFSGKTDRLKSKKIDRRLYFSTTNGSLLEFTEGQTLRWHDYGKPTGGDVVSIIDAGNIRSGMVFTVSSAGELYEFSKDTKPPWKKHIGIEKSTVIPLMTSKGCILNSPLGDQSFSLFLLTKEGLLMERRFHQRKWKWVKNGAPKGQTLTAITPFLQTETEDTFLSLFLTTATGHVFEYLHPKYSVDMQGKQVHERWIDHEHPHHARVARGISGIQLQFGRLIFSLDDGRLGELQIFSKRRGTSQKFEWSILEVPETEGWNGEYCSEERGMMNCIAGNEFYNEGIMTMKRRKTQECTPYIPLTSHNRLTLEPQKMKKFQTEVIGSCFRLRALHNNESFLLTTSNGLIFEYLSKENVWFWLRHADLTLITGALGSYNGSLFLVDVNGNLLMMERREMEITLINCTAMNKGRKVTAGPPWDGAHTNPWRTMNDDAIFFVSMKGRLLQFTAAYRRFSWKDCHHPSGTKVAFIADQEVLRMNIVFVVGEDGLLYQYNRVTELWHQHCQSPYLILKKSPATTIRKSFESLVGSLFMILENGGLVEYQWNSEDGWSWIEHGTPTRNLTFVGAPGPSTSGSQLFLIGSDGQVYRRYADQNTWKWKNHGFPYQANTSIGIQETMGDNEMTREIDDGELLQGSCDERVAAVRPIRLSEDSMIFELRDGRLAELRQSPSVKGTWEWFRIIATPNNRCAIRHEITLDS